MGWILDRLLWPAEGAYHAAVHARNRAFDSGWLQQSSPQIPTISIGNLGVGGAGKTPFAAWVAGRLASWGRKPAIVLRGYGADEVLVHHELNPALPVFASLRRAEGVAKAAHAGCDVVVLDDAFQHRSLARDLDVVLVSAESWHPPFRLVPRGPWRERPSALRRAQLVVVTRKTASSTRAQSVARNLAAIAPGCEVAVCSIEPTHLEQLTTQGNDLPLSWLRDRPVLAVASLADPQPFVGQLQEHGARVELLAFADHHPFDRTDAAQILATAGGRTLVMTRKEAVKLRPLLADEHCAVVLGQRVVIEVGADELERMLRKAVFKAGM